MVFTNESWFILFVVHDLARFMQNPGPEHVEAAYRVLRYILGHLDAGLTYHGSTEVLYQPYDHFSTPSTV